MNSTREQLLETVGELLRANPEMRFGQLISNLPGFAADDDGNETNLWDIEDELILAGARDYLGQLRNGRTRQPVAV